MNLQLELSQKQTINQQMLQSIRILQMSSQELEHYLEELCLENPVIELDPPVTSSEDEQNYERQICLARNADWLIATDRQNSVYYEDDSDNTSDFWQDSREKGETLEAHLRSQLLTRKFTASEQKIMDFLIDSLNSHGYLEENPGSTAALFSVEEALVIKMIEELQTLDPPGVGASNLTECLLLQIDRLEQNGQLPSNISSDKIRDIIRFYLEDIARNHLPKVMRALNLSRGEMDQCCTLIRSLSPRPANAFATRDYIQYVTPDAYVMELDGHLEIVMNDFGRRKFHANDYYVDLKEETNDPQLKQYLQEKIRQIHSVKRDIHQRTSTICKVIHVLAERQGPFFYQGPGNRVPLSLRDIAAELELHESTVSRAMQDKYLQCKWGIFPLNYFLNTAAVSSPDMEFGETRENIEQKIRSLIDGENKRRPLSDQAIADLLTREGTKISRRTVNKYRSEMGIPDKSGRKQ